MSRVQFTNSGLTVLVSSFTAVPFLVCIGSLSQGTHRQRPESPTVTSTSNASKIPGVESAPTPLPPTWRNLCRLSGSVRQGTTQEGGEDEEDEEDEGISLASFFF